MTDEHEGKQIEDQPVTTASFSWTSLSCFAAAIMLSLTSLGAEGNSGGICRIDGVLEYRAYNPEQKVIHQQDVNFTIVKSAHAWKVSVEPRLERASNSTAVVRDMSMFIKPIRCSRPFFLTPVGGRRMR